MQTVRIEFWERSKEFASWTEALTWLREVWLAYRVGQVIDDLIP